MRQRPDLVARLLDAGHPVYVWTVNEPADVDLMFSLGVTGIITDRPGYVRRRVDELPRTGQ